MTDHRDALARTIENALWARESGRAFTEGTRGYAAIDALRAEGWSIVKLRKGIDDLFAQDLPLYTITEGEA